MTLYDIASDKNRSEIERKIADLMMEGFSWDYIAEKTGCKNTAEICGKITMQIDGGATVMNW